MIVANPIVKQHGKTPETLISLEDAIRALRAEMQAQQLKSRGKFFGTVTLTLPYREGLMTQFNVEVNKIYKPVDVDKENQADRI